MNDAAPVLSPGSQRFLLAVARVIVPEVGELDGDGTARFVSIINTALSDKPAKVVRQFRFFLFFLKWMTVPLFMRRFDRLGAGAQTAVLHFLESFPFGLVRTGTWGLKALVFMAYYGQPEVAGMIGYAPSADGNERLRER
ncbi:MAG: hypothetical protein WC889_16645 [Myxococcota bacterium]|jgi:hypothetical protein